MVCVIPKLSRVITNIVKWHKNMHCVPAIRVAPNGPAPVVVIDLTTRCLDFVVKGFWVRVAPVDPIVYVLIKKEKWTTILCYMYAFILSICLVQLTRLFWSNTCLMSMCISGASRAASKHV